ncbi:MET1 [Candida margitis]|uniref:MET1 n=1 Tax=Candida margitis TaxID=1775924 RepID=UPI0022265704|nr:MET1 [Candida margitis]KAI5954108.1 MET1 [Candida margitis]
MTNLLASLNMRGEKVLLIGYSNVTSLRINSIIDSHAYPILLVQENVDLPASVTEHERSRKLEVIREDPDYASRINHYLTGIGRLEVDNIVDRVFVTLPQHEKVLKEVIFRLCKRLRIPVNTTDSPQFSTFTLLSTYNQGDFQLGVTTNGKGCKLASRLRREIVHKLPTNIDVICNKIGDLRRQIQIEDEISFEIGDDDDDSINTHKFNSLVHEFSQTQEEIKGRRNRWLSQIVEYYPLSKLATLSVEDLRSAYDQYKRGNTQEVDVQVSSKQGKIALVGSGPGSVALLTLGALQTIYQADLILADKLVPQEVLDLIPKVHGPELFIARKFPGNAERAQEELLSLGLEALQKGKFVLRLKQGDPYIFGRGGEEYNYFAEHGFEPIVIPGISSALAAPVVAGIPMTHREVADQVLICTGTGRKGAVPNLPTFVPSRTTIFLMALHRIVELIPVLVKEKGWLPDLPVAIIERASCPDQRVIRTTLTKLGEAVESCGSRPPGLLVTGYACQVIHKNPNFKNWITSEGFQYDFDNSKISVV